MIYKNVKIYECSNNEYSFKGFPWSSKSREAVKRCIDFILSGRSENWEIVNGTCKVKGKK